MFEYAEVPIPHPVGVGVNSNSADVANVGRL